MIFISSVCACHFIFFLWKSHYLLEKSLFAQDTSFQSQCILIAFTFQEINHPIFSFDERLQCPVVFVRSRSCTSGWAQTKPHGSWLQTTTPRCSTTLGSHCPGQQFVSKVKSLFCCKVHIRVTTYKRIYEVNINQKTTLLILNFL